MHLKVDLMSMQRTASFLALVTILAWGLAIGTVQTTAAELTGDHVATEKGDLIIRPINHATFALGWNGKVIYVDPVGESKRFENLPRPDLVLITDIHGDHLDVPTLSSVVTANTILVAPRAVAEKLPAPLAQKTTILTNGQSATVLEIGIEALPMYNTTPDRLRYHTKGRGNGYLLNLAGTRVYISGDTEDIPEMRALKNVTVAFVCMNRPYTMNEDQAASAVREFKPKIVYPYHYRGSNLEKFKSLVGPDSGVDVRIRDWYK